MAEPRPPTALVVDDDVTGRAFLRALLRRAGYVVEVAASGEEALAQFTPASVDVVFMDLLMPGIDGVETTRRLKQMCGEVFVPVIFVTGAGDEQSLTRAIDAGGDDFLAKPVGAEVLLAKLRAMARIRATHERTRLLHARMIADQEMAKAVFDRAVQAHAVVTPGLRSRMIPAEVFGGDLLLSALSPSGRLYVLFGDFTGHGLVAALGAMPVADAFRAMVAGSLDMAAILAGLNRKVFEALPRGHFLAACLVSVDKGLDRITVANCGIPALLLCGPDAVRERVESASFALGIVKDVEFAPTICSLAIERGDRLILASDGVSEASNAAGEAFGAARLEAVVKAPVGAGGFPAALEDALNLFRGATPFADDASIVEIVFADGLFPTAATTVCEPVEVSA